jgi:hypothetical protein
MIKNDEIIRIATLQRIVDIGSLVETAPLKDIHTNTTAFKHFEPVDGMLLLMTTKLLEGKPYLITTDNPETVRRAKSIATDIGASFEFIHEDDWTTQIRFDPALRQ